MCIRVTRVAGPAGAGALEVGDFRPVRPYNAGLETSRPVPMTAAPEALTP